MKTKPSLHILCLLIGCFLSIGLPLTVMATPSNITTIDKLIPAYLVYDYVGGNMEAHSDEERSRNSVQRTKREDVNLRGTLTPRLGEGRPAEVQNNTPFQVGDEPCSIDNQAFQAGERITYKLFYNWNFVWLAAGEVTFAVYDIGQEYHISVRGRTYSSYEWFFKVRDHYESYIDKESLLPRMHIKDVHQGNYRRYDRTTFDQEGTRAVSMRGVERASLTRKDIDFESCMHDLISIVYYTRNLDVSQMQIGQEIPMNILMDQEIYPLSLKYLGADDNVKVKGAGRYRTQVFSPQLVAGEIFEEGDEMKIYVGDDANRIPVMITSPVSVGEVRAVLANTRNLKHPFTCKR